MQAVQDQRNRPGCTQSFFLKGIMNLEAIFFAILEESLKKLAHIADGQDNLIYSGGL
jgi:hypothetical protein